MKKILFVIESLSHGGAEKSLINLLINIDVSNIEVDLLLIKRGGEFEEMLPDYVNLMFLGHLLPNNIFIRFKKRITYWILKRFSNNFHNAQLYWKVYGKELLDYPRIYDTAIAYNQGFSTYYVANKVNADYKVAWVNTDYKKAGYRPAFDKPFYEKMSKVVFVSKEGLESFKKAHRLNKVTSTTSIIPDIVDVNSILESSDEYLPKFDSDALIIVTVGRLAKAKGYELAIESCQNLIEKGVNVRWYAIGDGNERENLQNKINSLGLESHFLLLGYNKNPYPYIKYCDIYVQPSRFEGLGLSVIEAKILNKPIVCTNFITVNSLITNEKTGLIVEMSSSSITEALFRLYRDEELQLKFINNLSLEQDDYLQKPIRLINSLIKS